MASSTEIDADNIVDRAIALHQQNRIQLNGDFLNTVANVVFKRFLLLRKMEDLEVATGYYRQALDVRPAGHPQRSVSLFGFAGAMLARFTQLRKTEDLEEAIAGYRHTLDFHPPGHPHRSVTLNNLALAVYARFDQLRKIEDVEESIACHREALDLCPSDHPDHSRSVYGLANALASRFRQLERMEDLNEAIACHRQALRSGHLDRPAVLDGLGLAVFIRFQHLGKMEDLEEAIECHRRALDLCPPGHPDRSTSLNNCAIAVFANFEQLGRLEDLEEAITFQRQALDLRPSGHPDRSISLDGLASALSTRFRKLGKTQDLEEAIEFHHQALDLRPPGHPDRSASLTNLANTLATRFRQMEKMEDLNEAILCHRQALDLLPTRNVHRPIALDGFGLTIISRFEHLGRVEDLEEAIACHRQALDLCPPGHPHRSVSLSKLASALCTRFKHLGMMEDLEEALVYHRQALNVRPPGHPHRAAALSSLAPAVSTRFEQLGMIQDLEEAIECYREVLDLRPPGHPDRSTSLTNLANTLSTSFGYLRKMQDLDEAIECHHQVLALAPPGHPLRFTTLSGIAGTLFTRFQHLGLIEDLEEAISYWRQALNLCPPCHSGRSTFLNNFALAVCAGFRRLQKMDYLEEAIACHRQALDLCPPGHPCRSSSLNNVAINLCSRFKHLGKMEDLEEAIACSRQALDLCPPSHPHCSEYLNSLAHALSTRFKHLGELKDLEESVKHYFDADTILPESDPFHATLRANLASNMLELFHLSPSSCHAPHMISDAFTLLEKASKHSTFRAEDRFLAAFQWVHHALRFHHSSLLHACSTALTCFERCVTVTPTIHSWQKSVAKSPRSPTSVAFSGALAIELGSLKTAVELMEQGRTILWSKMRGYRYSLDKVRDVNEDLANQFDCVSRQLEHHTISSDGELAQPGLYNQHIRTYCLLSEKWDAVVEQIRQLDGFTNFLRAVPFANLQRAASEGPVIIINVSQFRSDAIILIESHPPVLVRLPDASPDALRSISESLSLSLARESNRSSIFPILRQLWNLVVSPVAIQLAILGVAENSRIWWSPTAELCALPLHAAGPYKCGQKNLPDLYISSYTPSLSSLINARSNSVGRRIDPKLLVMGQPNDNLENAKLPQVREEIRRIQSLDDSVNILFGKQANRETLLTWLQRYPWVHFACHGRRSPEAPFLSYFQLHGNERLTLVELMQVRLPNADLAFLSACHSASVNIDNTPDEAINLAAALQFCGFRSVFGTLWAMADIDGPDVAEDFYRYMFSESGAGGDFRGAAAALNHATREMRKRRVPVDRWVLKFSVTCSRSCTVPYKLSQKKSKVPRGGKVGAFKRSMWASRSRSSVEFQFLRSSFSLSHRGHKGEGEVPRHDC